MTDERQMTIDQVEGAMPDAGEVEAVEARRLLPVGEFTGEVHPLADLWPMMDDEELDALAADIAAHGLREPIVLDENGRLIDGRNRLTACQRAKVSGRFIAISSSDARNYIFSRNAQRRNTTAGQRAMIAVLADWDSRAQFVRSTQEELASEANVPRQRISEAALVMEWQPGEVQAVIDGETAMSVAYRKAQTAQQDHASEGAQFRSLKNADRELAQAVSVGKRTLAEAQAELAKRTKERQERVTSASRRLSSILNFLDPMAVPIEQAAREWLLASETATVPAEDFSLVRLQRAAAVLRRYLELREEQDETEGVAESGD